MKSSTTSIVLFLLIWVALWLGACSPSDQKPLAMLPPPTQPIETAIPQEPTATTDAEAPILPTPTTTIAENGGDAVTWNPDETPLTLETMIDDLTRPLFVTHAGDNSARLFIVEQAGVIRIRREGELLATPFLDITDRVNDGANEQGLLGLAFAPNYAESGAFYINYTDSAGDTVVARYQVSASNPDMADADSEAAILNVDQPASNHNGGMITFGPDGYLYIGMGDGGAANDRYGNGQNPDALLGKMLRIDVSQADGQPYAIPPDNPWIAVDWNGQDVRDEIWAAGLRNPWRFSFDRGTGDLWIGDVGQNQYEEVNHLPAASTEPANFGWPIMEATHCFGADECDRTGLLQPVAEYGRSDGCSVTGGHVYRGEEYPALDGVYFFADYCSGKVWAILPDGEGGTRTQIVLDTDMSISSFGEDERGELYVTDLSGGTVSRVKLAQD